MVDPGINLAPRGATPSPPIEQPRLIGQRGVGPWFGPSSGIGFVMVGVHLVVAGVGRPSRTSIMPHSPESTGPVYREFSPSCLRRSKNDGLERRQAGNKSRTPLLDFSVPRWRRPPNRGARNGYHAISEVWPASRGSAPTLMRRVFIFPGSQTTLGSRLTPLDRTGPVAKVGSAIGRARPVW